MTVGADDISVASDLSTTSNHPSVSNDKPRTSVPSQFGHTVHIFSFWKKPIKTLTLRLETLSVGPIEGLGSRIPPRRAPLCNNGQDVYSNLILPAPLFNVLLIVEADRFVGRTGTGRGVLPPQRVVESAADGAALRFAFRR